MESLMLRHCLGKSIGKSLEAKKMKPDVPEDLMNLIRKSVKLKTHLKKTKATM
jgi:ribosomal protein S15P/S13E